MTDNEIQRPDLGTLQEAARELSRLLTAADPRLEIWGQAAARLAEQGDAAAFYDGAEQLARDVDDMRAAQREIEALFRWKANPVDRAYALARAARAVALDRCEIDERNRPCSGPRTLTLSVWTVDGLSEVWEPLCVDHTVDYALRWDPSYAELVVSGEAADARHAIARMLSTRPGEMNVRLPGAHDDRHGRRVEPTTSRAEA